MVDNNVTANGSLFEKDYFHEVTYIVAVSINATLIALSLWILFSLVHFGVKTGQWSGRQKRNADKLNAGWIYTSVIVCAIIAVIRLTTSQITQNVGFGEDQMIVCEKINDALFVEYACVLFFSYVFLWLRQRTFYTNKMFNFGYSKILKVLSGSSIFILFAAGLGVTFVNTIPTNYPSSPIGCRYDSASESLNAWSWALCAITLVIGQVLLLVLLVYPLAKNSDDLKASCFCFEKQTDNNLKYTGSVSLSTLSKSESRADLNDNIQRKSAKSISSPRLKKRTSRTVKKIMIRTVVFGFTAVFTDISLITIVSTSIINQENPRLRRVSVTLYDMNVFLNLMLVVMSFMTWKKMLTSPCRKTLVEEASIRSSSSMS